MDFKLELIELLKNQNDLTWQQILAHVVFAAAIGGLIFICYAFSHNGTIYSKKFNVSLIVLTVLTSMALTVIGNNTALSLGMVGALSIVRFRTAIKDSRDTVFIFWAVIAGICCGAGDFLVASIGSGIVFLVLLFLGNIKKDTRILIIIRSARTEEGAVQSAVFQMFGRKATLKAKNTTVESAEFIYEVSQKQLADAEKGGISVSETIYHIKNIEYVNVIMQNDEVSV